jgi:hypothetical protein
MVIPHSYYTPEEVLAKCSNGEIALEDAIGALEIRRGYYERVSGGGAADRLYPITPEEAAEKIGAVKNAIEKLRAILYPPKLQIDFTKIKEKLREIRDKCIAGDCTKKAALALFDQAWLDFKNDTTLKFCLDFGVSQQSVLLQELWQGIENAGAMDIINGIRVEIEGIQEPAPDTQAPGQKAAETSTKDPIKVTLNWLAGKQWIKKEQLEAKPPVPINGGIWEHPKEYEWRITKTIAFIYRGLIDAAKNKEIPLEEDAIKNFMINNLKTKYGGEITPESLTKADKRRQTPTK